MKERSPLLKEMDCLLQKAIDDRCHPETIAMLMLAIKAQEEGEG